MIRVVHIDTGGSFRGGQKQVWLLIKSLSKFDDVEQFLFCPYKSPLKQKCSEFITASFDTGKSNLMRLLSRNDYNHFVDDHKIDIIHAHTSHAHSLATLISPGGKKPPIVVTRRSAGKIKFGSKTKYLRHNINYIAISEHVRNILASGGVDEQSVHLIRSMLELENYAGVYEFKNRFPEDKPVLIGAGAFDKGKGFLDILKALKTVSVKRDDFICYLYGDGPERENYGKYIEKNGLAELVNMPGWADDSREYLEKGDVFITASHTEGLNSSLLEAMASGLVVIASDIEPHAENIVHNQNGLLFKIGDPSSLADKINSLLDNREIADSMKKAAREKSLEYDCNKITKDIYSLYLRIAGANKTTK